MQNLIATTFEVVHYIALQAVHYKPLQEVHLSRYNQQTMILALQKLPEDTVIRDLVYKESLHGRKPIEKNGYNNPLYKTAVSR